MPSTNKPKMVFTLREEHHKAECSKYIFDIKASRDLPYKVTITPGTEDRSNKQNRLSFMWYKERGEQSGHGRRHERHYCKLTFGIPILRCESDEFNEFYTNTLDKLPYEIQLEYMEFIPVTRLMNTKQMVEYLTDVERDSAAQGWTLTHPDDLYYEALMNRR